MTEGFQEGLAGIRARISAMAGRVEGAFRLAMEGFDWSDTARIARAREASSPLGKDAAEITVALVALAGRCSPEERTRVESALGAVSRLAQVAGCVGEFCASAAVKIGEGLLFSDRATKEMEDLHAETGALLARAVLAFTAADGGLSRKVAESGRGVERMIDRISAGHEKRLASGACAIRSSVLFLELLDALRGIAVHAVGMACASSRGA